MSIFIENTEVFGWEAAIRGMRNPLNSWAKSDSGWVNYIHTQSAAEFANGDVPVIDRNFEIGPNDLDLMKRLIKAGTEHRKFMRMIHVQFDVTAPLYWWKEADTYKIATVRNSCSTMHKITAKEFTLDDFSAENLMVSGTECLMNTIKVLNETRNAYVNYETWDNNGYEKPTKKAIWYQIIQLLPSSYNQRATLDMNYETLYSIYHQRKDHKLGEWHSVCDWIENDLLYAKELIVGEE